MISHESGTAVLPQCLCCNVECKVVNICGSMFLLAFKFDVTYLFEVGNQSHRMVNIINKLIITTFAVQGAVVLKRTYLDYLKTYNICHFTIASPHESLIVIFLSPTQLQHKSVYCTRPGEILKSTEIKVY